MKKQEVSPKRYRTVFCTFQSSPETVAEILYFRKRVLIDHLGWKLTIVNGQERDEYDTDKAVYCGIYDNQELISCFRLIRTDHSYLAKDKFQSLSTKLPYPANPLIWEISRLAICPHVRPFEVLLYSYSAIFHFAQSMGAISLVAFAEVAKERLVNRIGIKTKLLGEPTLVGEDDFGKPIICVAGELPLQDQGGSRFEKLLSYVEKTEIEDAAALFRRSRISA